MLTGEASGDALGASILKVFNDRNIAWQSGGLAGPKMQEMGARSLFDITQLSVMGITAVLARLPKIIGLVKKTVKDIRQFQPDVILLIDSPDFNYAVAKRIKKTHPHIPVIKYICPSVWAWRQGRAKKMTAYVDHVLAVLPFEPKLMKKLGGPATTYIGHPLTLELADIRRKNNSAPGVPPNLLVLPGSRKGEVVRLLPIINKTLTIMQERGFKFDAVLPAVEHLAETIEQQIANWPIKPKLVIGNKAKKEAFAKADFALACSGTVMLELGFYAIPTVSIYKLDRLGFIVRYMVKAWTACLPNLITDKIVIPELFEEYANPQILARLLEELGQKGPKRDAQLLGFKQMRAIMCEEINSSEKAASIILQMTGRDKTIAP